MQPLSAALFQRVRCQMVWYGGDNITNNRIMTCDNVHHKQAGTLVWGVSDGTKTKPGGQSEAQSGSLRASGRGS